MKPGREALLKEAANNLRVGFWTGLIGGILLGLLFTAATLALNPQLLGSAGDVLILILGLQAVYAVFCLALGMLGALGKTAIFSITGRSLSDTKTAAFVTGTVFFLITGTYGYLWCRWHRIGGLVPEHPPTAADLPVLIVIAAVAVLLARLLTYAFYLLIVHFKKPERRQPGDLRKAFFVLVYMAGAFAVFLVVLQLTRPGNQTFAGLNREDIVASDAPLLFLGIDGLTRGDAERVLRGGSERMLRDEAEHASPGNVEHAPDDRISGSSPIDSTGSEVLTDSSAGASSRWTDAFARAGTASVPITQPTIPPAAWTLLATGQTLEAHGIVDYQAQLVRGLSRPFTVNPSQVGLFQLFQDVFPFFNLAQPVPMRSYMRDSKGLWNMATDAGIESAIVNWWVSWPAEKIRGRIVSNQTYLRLDIAGFTGDAPPTRIEGEGETYPGSLLQELAPLARSAALEGSGAGSEAREARAVFEELAIPFDVIASDLFYVRATAHLLRTGDPRLCMLYLPGPDVLRRLIDRNVPSPDRPSAWRRALEAYWTVIDPALDDLFRAASAHRRILLTLPGAPFPGESLGSGLVALGGPGAAAGERADPFQLTDLAPTVLWLLGLPLSEEMSGSARIDLLEPENAVLLGEPRVIASYGRLDQEHRPSPSGDLDAPMLELLRSLGYIDS